MSWIGPEAEGKLNSVIRLSNQPAAVISSISHASLDGLTLTLVIHNPLEFNSKALPSNVTATFGERSNQPLSQSL